MIARIGVFLLLAVLVRGAGACGDYPELSTTADIEILERVSANAERIFLEQASWTLPESFRNSGLAAADKQRLIEGWASQSGACLAAALAEYAKTTEIPLSEMVVEDGSFGLLGDGTTAEFNLRLETCIERAWAAIGATQ